MIDPLRRSDLLRIVSFGFDMATESPAYRRDTLDVEYTYDYLKRAFDAGILFGFAHRDGCIIGSVSTSWNTPDPMAAEWMLYVRPEHRGSGLAVKLIHLFVDEARQRGAKRLYVGSSTGINDEGVRKLYERLGFTSMGSALVKDI